ncbi:MAG: mechanosensitive ion channel [Saprospiraceae bacterium]|nr:mechanosensitive ion channel [Saprospiraceae bacterium]
MRQKVLVRLLAKFILVAILSVLWWQNTFDALPDPWSRFMQDVVGFLLFAGGLNLIISVMMLMYRIRKEMRFGAQDNITSGVQNIYVLIIAMAVVFFLLDLWGVDIKTVFTSLSIVAAAIAIVSREFISSIIAGFVIVFSKQLSIGDYVRIGDLKGKVVDLSLTKLALLSEDEDLIFISNDKAYHGDIINFTKGEIKRVSIPFELGTQFEGTVEQLEENLIKELEIYRDEIDPKSFNLRIVEIKKDSILFKFQYTLDKLDRVLEKEIKRKTARRVLNFIKVHSTLKDEVD